MNELLACYQVATKTVSVATVEDGLMYLDRFGLVSLSKIDFSGGEKWWCRVKIRTGSKAIETTVQGASHEDLLTAVRSCCHELRKMVPTDERY